MAEPKSEGVSLKAFELMLRKLEMTEKRQSLALAETRVQIQAVTASLEAARKVK